MSPTTAEKSNATAFKRSMMKPGDDVRAAEILQGVLPTLIDLPVLLKQAHWNVVGTHFRTVHLQLDEIVDAARVAGDDVAERIVTLGVPADGRSPTLAERSQLTTYPPGFQQDTATIELTAKSLHETIQVMREAIDQVGEIDPISQDLLIGHTAALEKYLWMVQAQQK
jgi:starvation-inducible DNA-binding protein